MSGLDPKGRKGRARAVLGAVEVVYAAARGSFVAAVALFAISSLGMVALLFIGNRLLQELVANGSSGSFTGRVWGLVVAALVIGGVVSFAGSAAAGMHRLLVERVIRYYAGESNSRSGTDAATRKVISPSSTTGCNGRSRIRWLRCSWRWPCRACSARASGSSVWPSDWRP